MRKFINIIESASANFATMHPSLDAANYQITSSFGDVQHWKAKILVGNSIGENEQIGDWDEVGYVLIDPKTGYFVPVARSDEHNQGQDLVFDLMLDGNFVSVYNGNNYVYRASDIKDMIAAGRLWLANGGHDHPVIGANEFNRQRGHLSELVATGDLPQEDFTKLSRKAETLIKHLDDCSKAFADAWSNPNKKSLHGAAKRSAATLLKWLHGLAHESFDGASKNDIEQATSRIKEADDLQALEEIIFGFGGVKNNIHNRLRTLIKDLEDDSDPYSRGNAFNVRIIRDWGNPQMANGLLGKF